MSALGKALRQHQTGQERAVVQPLKFFSAASDYQEIFMDRTMVYKIGATFATQIVVPQDRVADAAGRAKQQILHAVFGEFVGPLYEAEHLIDRGDLREAQALIRRVIAAFRSDEVLTT